MSRCSLVNTKMRLHVSRWTMGHFAVLIILGPVFTLGESVKTSKACYGVQSPMLPCTKHTLECSSGMIAIQDAYYTNSTVCTLDGLSSCNNINISSIPDTGRYQDFNKTQLDTLYRDCSNKTRCTFNGGKAPSLIHFSVVKYMCISGPTTSPNSNSITSSSTTEYISTVQTTSATETEKTSKACYGSQGLRCTKHTLECSSGMIAIQDAYYTNSAACTSDGISNCGNINVSSIQDTGRYRDFNETQLVTLYKTCSTKSRCIVNVDRKSASVNFSIVKFMCIKGDSTISGPIASPKSASYEFPAGIYVAGIFTGVGVLLVSGILINFLFIRRRFDLTKKQEAVPASVTHPTYADLSGPQETNNYDVINRQSNSETLQTSLYENVAKSP